VHVNSTRVDSHAKALGFRRGKCEDGEQSFAPRRYHQRGCAARRRQQQSFDQQAADHARPSRTERQADADFAPALARACQEERRHVETREQQHDTDGRHRQPGIRRDRLQFGMAVAHWIEPGADIAAAVPNQWPGCLPARGIPGELRLRLRHIRAGRQSRERAEPPIRRLADFARDAKHVHTVERQPDLGRIDACRSLEGVGHHADDRHQTSADRERFAVDRCAAERVPPESMADDGWDLDEQRRIARRQRPADFGTRADGLEEVG
jgi:hypothetical protein